MDFALDRTRDAALGGEDYGSADVVRLLEAVDVRIAAGITTLRRDLSSAREHLSEARELISTTLRRETASSWAETLESTPPAPPAAFASGGLTPRKARQVTEYIALRLGERIAIGDLASFVGLSRGYFCRAFRVTFGLSPHRYIEDRRIEAAQRLMLGTESSMVEIALATGFAESSHLSKTFRRRVGLTPSQWRREHDA